ncbi:MAG: hypothetical protein PVS3B3_24090 [Ktedonobacteraceae bacterium]
MDIEPHKNHLQLFLNITFSEIDDPEYLCPDITSIGHHGNGDIGVRLSSLEQIDDAMELFRQVFEVHWEEGVASTSSLEGIVNVPHSDISGILIA